MTNTPATGSESVRAERLTRATALATDTFGSEEKADLWLRRPNGALGGSTPAELLDSDAGLLRVEQVLGRLAHGLFS